MKTDIENNEWKVEAPYLASLQKENPFRVPEYYFDELPNAINSSLYVEKLKAVAVTPGFVVPDQYFMNSKDQIMAATADNSLETLPSSPGFSTPDFYFQKLQAGILARTTGQEEEQQLEEAPARAVPKIVRLWNSDLLKYASAACFILVTAFGLYLNQQNLTQETRVVEIANEQMLYDIDEQDIIDHIEGNIPEATKISPTHQELETYILNNYSQNDLSSAIN